MPKNIPINIYKAITDKIILNIIFINKYYYILFGILIPKIFNPSLIVSTNFLVSATLYGVAQCPLCDIGMQVNSPESEEPIVVFPRENQKYLKAFTYIKSSTIVKDAGLTKKILSLAKQACGEGAVVTHYNNDNQLILPIVIPVERYYALAEAIEAIESFLDKKRYDDARVTTYPVHGFEERFDPNLTK